MTPLVILRRRSLPLLCAVLLPAAGCADRPSAPVDVDGAPVEVVTAGALESGMPTLTLRGDGLLVSHLERRSDDRWALRVTALSAAGDVESASDVAARDDFFVNWADVPSVTAWGPSGERWVAHWLQRGPAGGYDYGVRVSTSEDHGATWSPPWTPHGDGTPTEHGFVSVLPAPDGYELLWLDGRRFAEGVNRMQLRGRRGSGAGPDGPERVVDELVCDCCQTDVVATPGGAVAVYRNRTEGEIRDIHAARWDRDGGAWTTLGPVHEDGWEIGGCPVNGPAVAAGEEATAVAWFTAAGDRPSVKLAIGGPEGEAFGPPVRIDRGDPVGRVDVAFAPDGDPRVLWMETRADGRAELLLARVRDDGTVERPLRVTELDAARGTGFPRLAILPDGTTFVAWTELEGDARSLRLLRLPSR